MRRHPAGKGSAPRLEQLTTPVNTTVEKPGATPPPAPVTPQPRSAGPAQVSSSHQSSCSSAHPVQPGESLWSLASSIDDTGSAVEIAELTEQIFEMNRHTIGADPDVIHPGQSLTLPEDCHK